MTAKAKKSYLLFLCLASHSPSALADSETMRKKDPVSVNIHFGGDRPLSTAIGIAYSFGPRFEMAIQAFKGNRSLKAEFEEKVNLPIEVALSKANLDALAGMLVTRFLPGNSFSLLFAAGYRQDKINYALLNSDLRWDLSASLTRENVIATAGFGNQWTFDNGVNFGIDWATFSWSLAKKSNTTLDSRGLTTEEAEITDRALQFWTSDLAKVSEGPTAVFTIGYRF